MKAKLDGDCRRAGERTQGTVLPLRALFLAVVTIMVVPMSGGNGAEYAIAKLERSPRSKGRRHVPYRNHRFAGESDVGRYDQCSFSGFEVAPAHGMSLGSIRPKWVDWLNLPRSSGPAYDRPELRANPTVRSC
jgi:hypothetical protein